MKRLTRPYTMVYLTTMAMLLVVLYGGLTGSVEPTALLAAVFMLGLNFVLWEDVGREDKSIEEPDADLWSEPEPGSSHGEQDDTFDFDVL